MPHYINSDRISKLFSTIFKKKLFFSFIRLNLVDFSLNSIKTEKVQKHWSTKMSDEYTNIASSGVCFPSLQVSLGSPSRSIVSHSLRFHVSALK